MSLVDPNDSLARQNEKLLLISEALMRRVEQKSEESGLAYQQFERAALLESQVRERTRDLERTLDLLQDSNARLEEANLEAELAQSNLTEAIETINEGFALFELLIRNHKPSCVGRRVHQTGSVCAGLKYSDR